MRRDVGGRFDEKVGCWIVASGWFFLDVIISEVATILQLLACDETRRDSNCKLPRRRAPASAAAVKHPRQPHVGHSVNLSNWWRQQP